MPTCLEHWVSMPATTCYGYPKRYREVETLKKQIILHGKKAGVVVVDDGNEPALSYDDFIKVIPKQSYRKRPRIISNEIQVVSLDITEPDSQNVGDVVELEEFQANSAMVLVEHTNVVTPPAPVFNSAPKPLVLNGLVIEVDPVSFMVNATQMCRAAGKRWIDYRRNDTTESYLKEIESKVRIPTLDLIKSNRGGDHSGTMVHRLVAYDLASWLSGDVKLQFYMWIAELLIENADLSTQIQELRANAALVPIAIAPAQLPIYNGVRKPLVLNGLVIEVDPDTFMVNATQMCKAAE